MKESQGIADFNDFNDGYGGGYKDGFKDGKMYSRKKWLTLIKEIEQLLEELEL